MVTRIISGAMLTVFLLCVLVLSHNSVMTRSESAISSVPDIYSVESLLGEPTYIVGVDLGYYIWIENETWHIRWNGEADKIERLPRHYYNGSIITDGQFSDVMPVLFEPGPPPSSFPDNITYTNNTITFYAAVNVHEDGVDFKVSSASTVVFDIMISEANYTLPTPVLPLPPMYYKPELVYLGEAKINPTALPFTVTL